MSLYFDNAATTKLHPEIISRPPEFMGNPSSLHGLGIIAEERIKAATWQIGRLLSINTTGGASNAGIARSKLIYTSGGTESNNLAILGAVGRAGTYGKKKKHIITCQTEHPSVLNCFEYLKTQGFETDIIKVSEKGIIETDELLKKVRDDTVLVSLFHINNETGSIHDINGLAEAVKAKNKSVIFHSDGVQAFGKHPVKLNKGPIDLYSFSGHKIHGPQGIGGLYSGVRLSPILFGGPQQEGLRPGTENVYGIFSLATAAEAAYTDMSKNLAHVEGLRALCLDRLSQNGEVFVNGGGSPYILNVSIPGIKGEVLLNALSLKGIYVSTGSACHAGRSRHNIISHLGLGKERADSAIRISFSYENSEEDVRILADEINSFKGGLK